MPRSLHLPKAAKAPLPSGPRIRRIPLGLARGLRFTVDFEYQLRFFLGLYETELGTWLRRWCEPGQLAYDIGADVGYQALVIARLTQASVVAFEPKEGSARLIERHYHLNHDRIGPVEVVRSMVGPPDARNSITLDDYASASPLGPPRFLLVDVDGAEVGVLRGAADLLRETQPHVLLETHSLELESASLDLLRAAGYQPLVVKTRRLLGDRRPVEHNRWIAAPGQ